MPPEARITKGKMLNTVLEITEEAGFETINARDIVNELQCSTRPVFTCCENMDEVKKDFLNFAYKYYKQFATPYHDSKKINSSLVYPLPHIEFAQDEAYLFEFSFIDDMNLNMSKVTDFYKKEGDGKRTNDFSESIRIRLGKAKTVFLGLFSYSHGIAVLTTAKKMKLDRDSAQKMVINVLSILIRQEEPD